MPTADNSFTTRIQFKKARTLAVFHKLNPVEKEGGVRTFTEDERSDRTWGQKQYVIQPDNAPKYIESCCTRTN